MDRLIPSMSSNFTSQSLPSYHLAFLFLFLVGLFSWLNKRERTTTFGPRCHPFLGCLIDFYRNKCNLLSWYTELLTNSPTNTVVISRLGAPKTVITANPDNVEHMLKSNFANYPKGEPFNEVLGDLLGSGIFNADGELWHSKRKIASHEFTMRSLRNTVINVLESETTTRLVPVLSEACASEKVVDMQDLLRRFAFDSICRISLGSDPGCLEPSLPDSDFLKAFDVASEISARRSTATVATVWKVQRLLGVGSEKVLKQQVDIIHKSITSLVIKRMEAKHEGSDLLSRLIATGNGVEATRDMVISFVLAGKDTTSAALTWFFWVLTNHPEIQNEVVNEVAQHAASDFSGELSDTYKRLKELTFLEACLMETMRLYPPVVWDSRHAAAEDMLPDGTIVGKGDKVTCFPYGMGRMEDLWGKNWSEFDPLRWLTAEAEKPAKVSPFKYPVFHAGPRICLGKEMAFIQMKYVASAVLRRFELRPVSEEVPAFVPLLTAHMAGGFKVAVKERSPKSSPVDKRSRV